MSEPFDDGDDGEPLVANAFEPPAFDALEVRRVRAEARRALFHDGTALPKLGRFEVQERIGAGAMGIVYGGFDPELNRRIALKGARREPGRSRLRTVATRSASPSRVSPIRTSWRCTRWAATRGGSSSRWSSSKGSRSTNGSRRSPRSVDQILEVLKGCRTWARGSPRERPRASGLQTPERRRRCRCAPPESSTSGSRGKGGRARPTASAAPSG